MPTKKPHATTQQVKEDQMHLLALDLGFFCTPATTFLVDLAARIAAAIRPRAASEVYQSAAFSLQNFPLELARQVFAFASQDSGTPEGTTTWTMETMDQILQVFGSIFEAGGPFCTGASKAFKTPSAPVIRVIAVVMPGAVISHVVLKRGVTRLYAWLFDPLCSLLCRACALYCREPACHSLPPHHVPDAVVRGAPR
jgi:hypothetical protein